LTPAVLAADWACDCHVPQSQFALLAAMVYQPKTWPLTLIRPRDSSSKKLATELGLLKTTPSAADDVIGSVVSLEKLTRTMAIDLAIGAAAVAPSVRIELALFVAGSRISSLGLPPSRSTFSTPPTR
jgi:hypothetical protein